MKSLLVGILASSFLLACGQSTRNTSGSPTITSFTANPTTLPTGGGSVTLSWNVTGATSLSISNGVGTETQLASGSAATSVTATTTFTLSATNASGTTTAPATVTVGAGPPGSPTINSFTVNPMNLPAAGGSVTIAWNVTGATSLSLDNGLGSVTPVTSGSEMATVDANTDTTAETITLTLSATNASGTSTAVATITLAAAAAAGPTINSFTVASAGGDNITFAWNVTGATSLSMGGANVELTSPLTPVTSGSTTLSVTESTIFGLFATNAVGTTVANVSVTVGGDYAPGFVGSTYTGTWGFLVNDTIVAPPGTGIVDSIAITEVSTNVIGVDIEFEWAVSTYSCTGTVATTVTAPNSFTQTGTGFVCQVTGDPNCGSYALTATGAFGSGFFDSGFPSDDLIISQTYTASGSADTGCNGEVTFVFDVVP